MKKEKHGYYGFLSKLVLALMNVDNVFSNEFFMSEFPVSSKTLSELRQGRDMCIYQYVRLIRCMMSYVHLIIQLEVLLKELRIVLVSHCDLVVATVPHPARGDASVPKEWVVVMKWDGVK